MNPPRHLRFAALLLAWLALAAFLARHVSVTQPADAGARCEAGGGSWTASSPDGGHVCSSPSEKASCFRPWSLSGPKKDLVCGDAIPPR